MTLSFPDRARGAILGLLVGDALGVPVEAMGRDEFPPIEGMTGGGSHGMPPGTWSDDGSLTLCTVESLIEKKAFDPADLGDRFVRWLFNRHWAARYVTFDVGFATREGIVRIRGGTDPEKAGLDGETNNGNGSLMRMMPIALFAAKKNLTLAESVDLAHRASSLTHRHARSLLCCGLFTLLVRALVDGKSPKDAVAFMREKAADFYASDPWNDEYNHVRGIMERNFAFAERHEIKSTGYVVDTFEAALWELVRKTDFKEAVLEAVNLGEDTDTVGAVTGSLMGLVLGPASIPEEWRKALARIDEVEALIGKFVSL